MRAKCWNPKSPRKLPRYGDTCPHWQTNGNFEKLGRVCWTCPWHGDDGKWFLRAIMQYYRNGTTGAPKGQKT